MFKIESYITPIILSYVDKYIKNFRLEDSTVSLWGGDACFHNLDLRLEVLEQELHLPVSFVSGHIRELLIHVPWTKLASEPITITINTIECILKLRGSDVSSSSSGKSQEKLKAQSEDLEAPPGYLTSLIHKIVGNIRIYCNNLILKYVEEDIVLSMNIKHFKFESANELWESSFTDLGFDEVKMRKLICINDLTICLDKRNAAGKIEVYQEPMLYKCSMTMHLLRMYHSASASRSSTTRLDIYCNSLEFGMSEQQLPMFIRLILLCYALKKKKREEDHEPNIQNTAAAEMKDNNDNTNTWTGWAWSYVSSVLSEASNEEWLNQQSAEKGHILQIGLYVDKASVIFKVTDANRERNYYQHKKLRYMPVLALELQGIYSETITHGPKWFNSTFGISEILLSPLGYCSCSALESPEGCKPIPYLRIGSQSSYYKFNSLFDADALENKGAKKFYNDCWDYHLINLTESVLLERTPAFAVDYIHEMAISEELTQENLSEMSSNFEYSNLPERDYTRIFIAPLKLRLCSGFHHRLSSMVMAAINYEYVPYYIPAPDPDYQDLLPPSEEDFDALTEFIPLASIKVTFFAPVIEFETADHPHFVPKKGKLYRKHKKVSAHAQQTLPQTSQKERDSVKLVLEFQCLDLLYVTPFYVNRLVYTTCQLPDPPKALFDACFKKVELKVLGLTSRLVVNTNCQTTILVPFNASFMTREILKPQYWTDPDVTHLEWTVESENLTLNGTKAKMLLIYDLMMALFQIEGESSNLLNSSVMVDACNDEDFPYMELYIEGIRFRKVTTHTTISIDVSLDSVKAFIFETFRYEKLYESSGVASSSKHFSNKNIQQILFISGPEPKNGGTSDQSSLDTVALFTATIQYPINPDKQIHPTIVTYNIQEIRICVDPLVFKWFLYKPQFYRTASYTNFSDTPYKVKSTDSSIFESSRKASMHLESVHSSSDRDKSSVISKKSKILRGEPVDVQEKTYNFLRDWFNVWKSMIVSGEISRCTIYFPMVSLSAVGSQGIQEAVDQAILKKDPPDIMIITLPYLLIHCTQRQNLKKYITHLPVSLPGSIWSPDRSCFPWTLSIKDLSCYTIQNGLKLDCLTPCSLNATIGLSTKNSKPEANLLNKEPLSTSPISKNDISSLGICVHVDMTPVLISTCEVQVYLFASILYGLVEVASSFIPSESNKSQHEFPTRILESIGSRSESMITIPETSAEQHSQHSSSINSVDTPDEDAKLTAWLQWTITKFTIELNSMANEVKKNKPKMKLVIDTEDIVSSIDFQNVYLKIKSKVGSISVEHFKLVKDKWQAGPYLGLVMRHRDDYLSEERHEDNAFINLTITRASCRHTHTLWGTLHRKKDLKMTNSTNGLPTRFITEIVVSIKPTDFLLSFKTLKSFYLVMEPLFAIEIPTRRGTSSQSSSYVTNQILPLAYLECHDVRVIIPVSMSKKTCNLKLYHDVYIFQISKISLSPSAVNPICRTPYRPDLYQHAARSRILNIPGSDMEDRQYQLDIIGISLNTGAWKDVELILNQPTGILTSLHGTSENPAVEWNNLERMSINTNPSMHLCPILEKIDMSIVAAPAMVYKEVLVCCNSIEINIVSDVMVNLCLSQVKLALYLFEEFIEFMKPVRTVNMKIQFPYLTVVDSHEELDLEALKDSGIESSEFKSAGSSFKHDIYRVDSDKHISILKNSSANLEGAHSLEVLFTGGKISLSLYRIDYDDNQVNEDKYDEQVDNRKLLQKNNDSTYDMKQTHYLFGGINPSSSKTHNKSGISLKGKFKGIKNSTNEITPEDEFDKRYVPLCYILLSQPNFYFLEHKNNRKIHFCLFNVSAKISGGKHNPSTTIPISSDYKVPLLETLAGMPHSDTGIPPAFLTVKVTTNSRNNTELDVHFARPTRITCSKEICNNVSDIHKEIMNCIRIESFQTPEKSSHNNYVVNMPLNLIPETSENYLKFQEIKERVFNINTINIETDQLVLVWETRLDYKLRLSIGKIKNNFNLVNRPEKVSNLVKLECVSLIYEHNYVSQMVLNPWSFVIDLLLFWESWQYIADNPQTQIIADSDCLMITLCPERLEILNILIDDVISSLTDLQKGNSKHEHHTEEKEPVIITQDSEQYYKDDLRAGAFQFVDSNTDNRDEIPLPYQVMFWNKNIAAMAWRYPQPRCLTKVRVFPVPLKVTIEAEQKVEIRCSIEYWSECHSSYLTYTQFILPEDEILHLELPKGRPHSPFACVWRMELSISMSNMDDMDIFSVLSPRALAACMRIDSYFNRILIPDFSVAFSLSRLRVSLFSKYDKEKYNILPRFLKGYTPDLLFPSSQCFAEIILDNFKLHSSSWNFNVFLVDMVTSLKVLVLEYSFLTLQPMIECSGFKFETSVFRRCDCNFISKSISVSFSPSIAHSLAVNAQLWNLNYSSLASKKEENFNFCIVTRYVICNDTNIALKFGQNETDEEIMLMPKYFNLYSWRTQRRKQELRVSLEGKEWLWSQPFSLETGTRIIDINEKKRLTLNLTIVALSATQYQVIFSGQLVIANMLLEHFELKIVRENVTDNRKIINQVVAGNSMTTSMVINYNKAHFLRLRFYGLDTSWSGDIPLMEHAKSSQPWLVKVPLMERGQFLSIWCRVVVQEFTNGRKILAMLWPLFSIKSNLPISTNVQIETPTLNYHGEVLVKSHGELQQLYCPGTIDHAHQLTFQLQNVAPGPNPYVPLNYSLIDHDTFFRRMDKVDINDIIEYLKTYSENEWPYFGDELKNVNWVVGEQPETHVQVKYHNSCQYSSSLMVELLPWCLLVNTLGCTIGIKVEKEEVCTVQHNGIVTPPKIEENFNVLVYIDDSVFTSDPLQFAKPATWSQNFYMPKILGIIPTDGSIVCNVKCDEHICRLSIRSYIANEIRLLKVSSSHILCNNTGYDLQVMCLAVPNTDESYDLPDHSKCNIVTAPKEMFEKNQGLSIIKWFNLEKNEQISSSEHVLYMVFSLNPALGWSKPIKVDEVFTRKTATLIYQTEHVPIAITNYESKGQLFISVHHDTRPQIYIENNSGVTLYCAQRKEGDEINVLQETEHFEWFCEIKDGSSNYYSMMTLIEKFPDISPLSSREYLVLSKEGVLRGSVWSSEVNLTDDADQYLKIPFYGDVRIIVKNSSCLTYIKVESVSKIEINAKDIRSRLLHFEETIKAQENSHSNAPKITHSLSAEALNPYAQKYDHLHQTVSTSNVKDNMDVDINFSQIMGKKSDSEILPNKEGEDLFCTTIPMLMDWKSLNMMVIVSDFTFTLLSDIDMKTGNIDELTTLTCDNIAVSTIQSECMHLDFCVQNIQIDNQLYSKRIYDFPVVMLMQESLYSRRIHLLDLPSDKLIEEIKKTAALKLSLIIDTWIDTRKHKVSGIQELMFNIQPFNCYLEDTFLLLISEYLNTFLPTNLIFIPMPIKPELPLEESLYSHIPDIVLWQSAMQAHPLTIRRLRIEPISVMLSVHSSIKMYLALDQSPLFFVEFERKRIFTNAYRLGHTLTMHYLSGAIFRAGWMVSSLEILGSPVGLARAMGSGLKDFVALPFRGLLQGPVEFLYGVTHGSASLMKHVTAGTLQSFTKMASSVARNLDYLTLDEEHVKRAEEQRRQRPSGVTEGFMQGLSGLGISILGAIGGIAHHPLQSVISEGGSPRSLAAGLGLGLVGIITKPLSGAAELLALTGQGLLQGAGWNNMPEQRNQPIIQSMFSGNNSILKYEWKLIAINDNSTKFLHMTDATSVSSNFQYASVALIITNKNLIIVNADEDVIQKSIILSEVEPIKSNSDPTLLSLELVPTQPVVLKVEDDVIVEMDPASRARVADYVKNTVGLLQVTGGSRGPSEMSISPLSSPGGGNEDNVDSRTILSFYVNPQDRNYFLCLLAMAKNEELDVCDNYPVL